jgi:hypothetical protein
MSSSRSHATASADPRSPSRAPASHHPGRVVGRASYRGAAACHIRPLRDPDRTRSLRRDSCSSWDGPALPTESPPRSQPVVQRATHRPILPQCPDDRAPRGPEPHPRAQALGDDVTPPKEIVEDLHQGRAIEAVVPLGVDDLVQVLRGEHALGPPHLNDQGEEPEFCVTQHMLINRIRTRWPTAPSSSFYTARPEPIAPIWLVHTAHRPATAGGRRPAYHTSRHIDVCCRSSELSAVSRRHQAIVARERSERISFANGHISRYSS